VNFARAYHFTLQVAANLATQMGINEELFTARHSEGCRDCTGGGRRGTEHEAACRRNQRHPEAAEPSFEPLLFATNDEVMKKAGRERVLLNFGVAIIAERCSTLSPIHRKQT
jgi:hypothetical protein